MLGDIYVIPLGAILDEIKRVFNAVSIILPTAESIIDIIATASLEDLSTPESACIETPLSMPSVNQWLPADYDLLDERNKSAAFGSGAPLYRLIESIIPTDLNAAESVASHNDNVQSASSKGETDSGYCSVNHSPYIIITKNDFNCN